VFTTRYALNPYITQILFVFKGLMITINTSEFFYVVAAYGYMFQPLVVFLRPSKYVKLKLQ